MMSEQRARKISGVDQTVRGRPTTTKGSGDTALPNIQLQERNRSKSKHKMPKGLRYDLDNALIGLCDVWFDDIKPHLIRNNIKVHAHPAVASGDHRQPSGATGCSHVDPGAASDHQRRQRVNYADCCSTLPTASKVQSHRQLSPLCLLDSSPPIHHASETQNPSLSCKQKKRQNSRRRPPAQEWKVPRLCRTYSLLTPVPPIQLRRPTTEKFYRKPSKYFQPQRCPKMLEKSTQTPPQWQKITNTKRQEAVQTTPTLLTRNQNHNISSKLQNNRKKIPYHSIMTQNDSSLKSSCLRCPVTTTFFPSHSRKSSPPVPALFQDDLIEIIAEKNDKQLRLLFQSPPREESHSTNNLLNTAYGRSVLVHKKVPWR